MYHFLRARRAQEVDGKAAISIKQYLRQDKVVVTKWALSERRNSPALRLAHKDNRLANRDSLTWKSED